MNDILAKIGVTIASAIISFIIIVAIANIYGEIIGSTNCAYCHGTITEDADYVCMTDGRRMHTGCYMRFIRDGNFEEDTDER